MMMEPNGFADHGVPMNKGTMPLVSCNYLEANKSRCALLYRSKYLPLLKNLSAIIILPILYSRQV